MADWDRPQWYLVCDACEAQSPMVPFRDMWRAAVDAGWTTYSEDGDLWHLCPRHGGSPEDIIIADVVPIFRGKR